MDQYLSFWNLMAYDYSGAWDSTASHQAQLFGSNPSDLSTDRAVRWYTDHGVPKDKIVIGIPLYGRSFLKTKGAGQPFSGVGEGSWEAGTCLVYIHPCVGSELLTRLRLRILCIALRRHL